MASKARHAAEADLCVRILLSLGLELTQKQKPALGNDLLEIEFFKDVSVVH